MMKVEEVAPAPSGLWLKVDKTLRHHARAAVRAARGLWWDFARPAVDRPLIVVGCSRAGTTLVYKTLSESCELGTLQRETHDFWGGLHPLETRGWATHALGAGDASPHDRDVVARHFFSHTGRRRFVDKNNQNGLCVPYLQALFPDAHFVYVKRSPGDNLHSLIEGWGKPDAFATWSERLPAEVAVDGGRYRRWCFFLAEGWRDYVSAPIEAVCAFQYRAMNESILAARSAVPAGQWTEIGYEDLVRDPVAGFREVFARCGLAFTPALERHCASVLERPYNAFSAIRLDKWKDGRNRDRIERVLPGLVDLAHRMGYAL